MSATERKLIGGPLDGITIAVRGGHAFLWIDVRKGNRCCLRAGRHRVLYKREDKVYVFAGHTWAECGGCGGFVDRLDGHNVTCSLCGGALARNVS